MAGLPLVVECGSGEYRAEWKVASQASTCNSCGDGISSNAADEFTQYAAANAAATVAAPPMSLRIYNMDLSGFRFNPPVSKHTPFPHNASAGPGPGDSRISNRGAR